jgi:hypothetical protein
MCSNFKELRKILFRAFVFVDIENQKHQKKARKNPCHYKIKNKRVQQLIKELHQREYKKEHVVVFDEELLED